jgi:hypothetical protein
MSPEVALREHFRGTQQCGRFRSEADMLGCRASAANVFQATIIRLIKGQLTCLMHNVIAARNFKKVSHSH